MRTIDCAMVPKLNEQFIITADVMSQLARDVSDALIASNVAIDDSIDDDQDVDGVTVNHGNEYVQLNGADGDVVNEVAGNCEPADSFDESETSCQKVAQEQREDETLKGCLKLAKEGKRGFILFDDLLNHKKTVMGQVIFKLVVPQLRRKHVSDLCHNN